MDGNYLGKMDLRLWVVNWVSEHHPNFIESWHGLNKEIDLGNLNPIYERELNKQMYTTTGKTSGVVQHLQAPILCLEALRGRAGPPDTFGHPISGLEALRSRAGPPGTPYRVWRPSGVAQGLQTLQAPHIVPGGPQGSCRASRHLQTPHIVPGQQASHPACSASSRIGACPYTEVPRVLHEAGWSDGDPRFRLVSKFTPYDPPPPEIWDGYQLWRQKVSRS